MDFITTEYPQQLPQDWQPTSFDGLVETHNDDVEDINLLEIQAALNLLQW